MKKNHNKLQKKVDEVNARIKKAIKDDIWAIEPNSTWESLYKFEKLVLLKTRLKVYYKEDSGYGWKDKIDSINLTEDSAWDYESSMAMFVWILKAIKKGYKREMNQAKRQTDEA